MYLLEHDAKQLLAAAGIPIPDGLLLERGALPGPGALPPGPWMVKGQIAAGGRGKAGIVRKAGTADEVSHHAAAMFGVVVKDRVVDAVRVERQIAGAAEAYLGLLLDPSAGGVRVILSGQGGMEVENLPPDAVHAEVAPPEPAAIAACAARLAARVGGAKGAALSEAAARLAQVFISREALLIEVNPLFVLPDGAWLAGDAKVVTDDNALPRQDALRQLLERRSAAYPDAARKAQHGFDYVVVDPAGEVGLLTTGAGLSMMLIDEMRAAGLKPYNFLDIRTGGLRGETRRIVQVLEWVAEGRNVKVLLVNIFAGITDLAEFSRLLVDALAAAPALHVPVVARLVGNGLPAARKVLEAAGIPLHTDLDAALAAVRTHLQPNG